jgi:hypothetical protein
MRQSLEEALGAIFGGVDSGNGGELPADVAALVTAARQALEDANAALLAGDLALYQAKVNEAATLLTRAEELAAELLAAGS